MYREDKAFRRKKKSPTHGSFVKSNATTSLSFMMPATHANRPSLELEGCGEMSQNSTQDNVPNPRRIVTLNLMLPVERLRHVNTAGTANRAMSQKIPTPAWKYTIVFRPECEMHTLGMSRTHSPLRSGSVYGCRESEREYAPDRPACEKEDKEND